MESTTSHHRTHVRLHTITTMTAIFTSFPGTGRTVVGSYDSSLDRAAAVGTYGPSEVCLTSRPSACLRTLSNARKHKYRTSSQTKTTAVKKNRVLQSKKTEALQSKKTDSFFFTAIVFLIGHPIFHHWTPAVNRQPGFRRGDS